MGTLESNNYTHLRIGKWIIGCALWLSSTMVWAISNEQEQQFLYYFYAAHQAIEQEDYDKAFMFLDFCEQINPFDGLTKDYLGVLYEAIGENSRAHTYFQEAYECAPFDCWRRYCNFLLQSDQDKYHQLALKILERTAKQQPKNEDVWPMLQQAYIHTAKWKQALQTQDQIDQLLGYDAYSALNRYRILSSWGKQSQAMQAIDDYLLQDPREYRFLLFKGDVLVQKKQYLEAFLLFAQIGDSLANIEEINGAFMAYEKALELDSKNLYILNNYAYLLAIHEGDLKKAEQMSQITIQSDPNNATYLDTYAWILHLQGQHSLAAFYIQKALENVSSESEKNIIQEHWQRINEP